MSGADVGRVVGSPLDDLVAEAERIMVAVRAARAPVRLTGGIAILRRCPSAAREPLARDYADVDLVVKPGGQVALTEIMAGLGYLPNKVFNALHGMDRLYYSDPVHGRHVDAFVGSIKMCHRLDVSDRLERLPDTLTVTDLLLTKLQIVELNRKDLLDLMAILVDHKVVAGADDEIDSTYLEGLWGSDWPLWRTCQLTLAKVLQHIDGTLSPGQADRARKTIAAIQDVLERGRKTAAWKLRARIGDRVRWYHLPEEVE